MAFNSGQFKLEIKLIYAHAVVKPLQYIEYSILPIANQLCITYTYKTRTYTIQFINIKYLLQETFTYKVLITQQKQYVYTLKLILTLRANIEGVSG